MKKLISLLLSLVMLLSFASCGETSAGSSSEQTSVSSSSDELKALQDQIVALQSEKAELLDSMNEKTGKITAQTAQINNLTSENEELQAFKDLYEEFVSRKYLTVYDLGGGGSYYNRTANLPEYKDGSLTLIKRGEETKFVWEEYLFDRKYRMSYYDSPLPLSSALIIVRDLKTLEVPYKWQFNPVNRYVGNPDVPKLYAEPVMHYFTWFILAYNVTREEMEQVVELVSNLDSGLYTDSEKQKVDFTHEFWELPNVDILYTFDQDIINEYYRYA